MLPARLLRKASYVNYYQYPPMHPLGEANREPLLAGLALGDVTRIGVPFSLFLSVPYCRVRCHSCPCFKNFLPRVNTEESLDQYLDLIEAQAGPFAGAPRFSNGRLLAVYLGGGTASVLSPRQIGRVVSFLKGTFPMQRETEITLEGNPKDFTADYLAAARGSGVTRVSLGYQSSHEDILRQSINSPHTSGEGLSSIKAALKSGFFTVNVDLMYRMPSQTRELWEQDIELMIALRPQSITMNEYVVHNGSPSEKLITRGRLPEQVTRPVAHEWYATARERLLAGGYGERRIGTFTLPGHEQQYGKLSYSLSTDCVGVGAGAYSFVNGHMFGAPTDPDALARLLAAGFVPAADRASPKATPRNLMERWLFFALLSRSLDREAFAAQFGRDVIDEFPLEFQELEREGLVEVTPGMVDLTELGVQNRNTVLYTFYSQDLRVQAREVAHGRGSKESDSRSFRTTESAGPEPCRCAPRYTSSCGQSHDAAL